MGPASASISEQPTARSRWSRTGEPVQLSQSNFRSILFFEAEHGYLKVAPVRHAGPDAINAYLFRKSVSVSAVMRGDEVLPCRRLAALRRGRDAVPAESVFDLLIGNGITEIGKSSHDPVIVQARVLSGNFNDQVCDWFGNGWPPRTFAILGPSNFCATSRRYPARIVSVPS
jgi:hypothetical protein